MRLPNKNTLALWSLVERYSEHIRPRLKHKSLRGIRAGLFRFCVFMAERGCDRITQVTAPDVEAYQLHLVDLEVSTQQNYLVAARQFLRWLEQTSQLFENPAARLVTPKRRRKIVRIPSEGQVALLLETPDTNTSVGLRDRAWLELAYATGARRIELVRLKVQDLDLRQRTVRLFGKGDKERLLPVGSRVMGWLKRYLSEARPKLAKGSEITALWLSSHGGGPLGYEAVQQQLRVYTRKAGLPTSLVTAHNLRRACATHLLDHGASPLILKELLGHERTGTLSHYLVHNIAEVKAAHRHSPPGG
jgi:integrase/recombinase XerD